MSVHSCVGQLVRLAVGTMHKYLIEAFLHPMQQDCVPQAGLHIGICGDDAQESGHVGVNHAAALGYAPYPHLLPLDVNLQPGTVA